MFRTELKLSVRGLDMVIFTIAMPLAVAVILGIIYGSKPAFEGADHSFLAQSFGALAAIGICASGLMGLPLVIADYRHKKILKRYKVTPVSPTLILAAQFAVNLLYSALSLVLMYGTLALFYDYRMAGSPLVFTGAYCLVLLSIYSLGIMVAGIAANIKTANLLCVVLYFPMLIFSGATLPYEVMPRALQQAANVMPLTQGIKLLKDASLGSTGGQTWLPVIVMVALAVICTGAAVRFFKWE
jgi:ABC-2 type transport system permease protein